MYGNFIVKQVQFCKSIHMLDTLHTVNLIAFLTLRPIKTIIVHHIKYNTILLLLFPFFHLGLNMSSSFQFIS